MNVNKSKIHANEGNSQKKNLHCITETHKVIFIMEINCAWANTSDEWDR